METINEHCSAHCSSENFALEEIDQPMPITLITRATLDNYFFVYLWEYNTISLVKYSVPISTSIILQGLNGFSFEDLTQNISMELSFFNESETVVHTSFDYLQPNDATLFPPAISFAPDSNGTSFRNPFEDLEEELLFRTMHSRIHNPFYTERQIYMPISPANLENHWRDQEFIQNTFGHPLQELQPIIWVFSQIFEPSFNDMFESFNIFENVGLSKHELEGLPRSIVTQQHVSDLLTCTTCLENFILNEEILELSCRHMFHTDCIVNWLKENNTCPICRQVVDPEFWIKDS